MTKPAAPPSARHDVVEIEAMDVAEWESGQRTPQAPDANLAELVRKTASQPEPPTRVQTVARERARTQLGAPVVTRPPNRARTEPPGPPPKSARPRTPGGGAPQPSARPARVPDIPAGPGAGSEPDPRRSLAQTPVGGVDFSLPVTATGEASGPRSAPESRRSLTQTPVGGVDFSLPVTATSPGMPAAPGEAPEPRRSPAPMTTSGIDFSPPVTTSPAMPAEPVGVRPLPLPAPPGGPAFSMPAIEVRPRPSSEPSRTATATSDSGARPPEPLSSARSPSPFAEPSRGGPGRNASPAGGAEPNTAWPPRPIPADPVLQLAPRAAPERSSQRAELPRRDEASADRLNVALSRGRLWWIGGGLASASVTAILLAVVLPNPDGLPPGSSDATQTAPTAQGPRHDAPAQPVDRAAADLRDRVRIARDAAAAAAAAAANAPAVERRPARRAPADPELRSPPDEDAAAVPRPKKSGPHRVIVDYTSRPSEPPPPGLVAQSEEDPAIGQARGAYTTGNQRLFVGDLDGAVRAYHEALELYPGYVGGYRGLGLAYEQLGDKASALAALRSYVTAAPNARDVALIKKRIAHLQRR
jgi:tetratricopeptide repeat protein